MMVRVGVAAAVGLGVCGRAPAQDGGTISDGNMVFVLPVQPPFPNMGPDLLRPSLFSASGTGGPNHTYQQDWFYRLAGDTREYVFNSSGGATQTIDPANRITVVQNYGSFRGTQVWEVVSTGTSTGYLRTSATIENLTTAPMSLSLFYYLDLDMNESPSNDAASLVAANTIGVSDATGPYRATFAGPGADAFQVTPWRTLLQTLTNDSVNNLDGSGLPFGPGDFTGAFQWNVTIPALGSATAQAVVTLVPGPGGLVVMVVGVGVGAGVRGRRRAGR